MRPRVFVWVEGFEGLEWRLVKLCEVRAEVRGGKVGELRHDFNLSGDKDLRRKSL